MESTTIEPPQICSLCDIDTENYYVFSTKRDTIYICTDCLVFQFDYLMTIITPGVKSRLIERLRAQIKENKE